MKRFIGLDVHKTVVEACVVDEAGQRLFRRRIDCTREALLQFAKELTDDDSVALEVTTNAWAVADLLEPFVGRVVVSNPMKTKAIAEAKVKTDKVDAEVLRNSCGATTCRASGFRSRTRSLRQLTSRRERLVSEWTRLKNRVQSVLASRLVIVPVKTLLHGRPTYKVAPAALASFEERRTVGLDRFHYSDLLLGPLSGSRRCPKVVRYRRPRDRERSTRRRVWRPGVDRGWRSCGAPGGTIVGAGGEDAHEVGPVDPFERSADDVGDGSAGETPSAMRRWISWRLQPISRVASAGVYPPTLRRIRKGVTVGHDASVGGFHGLAPASCGRTFAEAGGGDGELRRPSPPWRPRRSREGDAPRGERLP